MLESNILAVAQEFAREATKLETLKAASNAAIELMVRLPSSYSDEKAPKITLCCRFWSGSNHETVEAASLGALMDEVHRRCGFSDKQSLAMDTNNRALVVALEAPKGWTEVES